MEGPPGSGKTSLVSKLRAGLTSQYGSSMVTTLHGFEGVEQEISGPQYLDKYLNTLEDYIPGSGQHILCDGWHWGMAAFKESVTLTQHVPATLRRYVSMKLAQLGAVIVHVNPSHEVLVRRQRQANPYARLTGRVAASLPHLRKAMVSYSHDSDATVMPSTSSLAAIVSTARHVEEQAEEFIRWSPTSWTMYLGSPQPSAVLVDLEPAQYEVIYPGPHTGNLYLHKALYSLSPEKRDEIGLLNVAHVTSESFVQLMLKLGKPRILALGKDADTFLGQVAHTTLLSHRRARRAAIPYLDYAEMLYKAISLPVGTDLTKWRIG